MKNKDKIICPHCGHIHIRGDDDTLENMTDISSDYEMLICVKCKKEIMLLNGKYTKKYIKKCFFCGGTWEYSEEGVGCKNGCGFGYWEEEFNKPQMKRALHYKKIVERECEGKIITEGKTFTIPYGKAIQFIGNNWDEIAEFIGVDGDDLYTCIEKGNIFMKPCYYPDTVKENCKIPIFGFILNYSLEDKINSISYKDFCRQIDLLKVLKEK